MRLIYVTEYLWGHECLLNLYIVVTFAPKYLSSREDANAWIMRQVEINWRFKHIFGIVGNNPNRFIFVDNPDLDSGEPGLPERRLASTNAVMKMLCLHPKELIPPFTSEMMKKAQDMTAVERKQLQEKEEEVQRIQKEIQISTPTKPSVKSKAKSRSKNKGWLGTKNSKAGAKSAGADAAAIKDDSSNENGTVSSQLQEVLTKAKNERLAAQKAMAARLAQIKADKEFQEAAAQQFKNSAYKFGNKWSSDTPETTQEDDASFKAKKAAGHRMVSMLSKKLNFGKRNSTDKVETAPKPQADSLPAENLEQVLDQLQMLLKRKILCSATEQFKRLGGWDGSGALTPLVFNNFVRSLKIEMQRHHVGGLWRRADANCDGQIDLQEFRAFFGEEV